MSAQVLELPRAHGAHGAPRRTPLTRRLAGWLASLALTVGAVGFLALAVGPHLLGYRTAVMLTGSMTGTIDAGDLVVSVPTPADEVAVGDILTFRTPTADHHVETHRVIAVRRVDGRVVVRTQGDANAEPDPWEATIDDATVWRTEYVVPHVGTAIRAVRATLVHYGTMWVAVAGVVALGLALIWRPERRR